MTASLRFKKLDLQKKLQEESGTNWHWVAHLLSPANP